MAGGEQFADCTATAPPPLSHSSARHTSVGSTPLARLRAPAAVTLAFALALAAVADKGRASAHRTAAAAPAPPTQAWLQMNASRPPVATNHPDLRFSDEAE